MNPQQLWETNNGPVCARHARVTTEDAEKANAVFTTLMGNEVAPSARSLSRRTQRVVKNSRDEMMD